MTDTDAEKPPAVSTVPTPRKGRPPRDWGVRFLREFRRTFNVKHSATVAGVHRDTVYERRKRNPEFAKRWDDAYEQGRQRQTFALERSVMHRAIYGTKEPVFFEGVEVGHRRVFNVAREAIMLKAHGSERYRQDVAISGSQEFDDIARKLVNAARTIEAEATVEVSVEAATPELDGGQAPNP